MRQYDFQTRYEDALDALRKEGRQVFLDDMRDLFGRFPEIQELAWKQYVFQDDDEPGFLVDTLGAIFSREFYQSEIARIKALDTSDIDDYAVKEVLSAFKAALKETKPQSITSGFYEIEYIGHLDEKRFPWIDAFDPVNEDFARCVFGDNAVVRVRRLSGGEVVMDVS